MKQSVCITIPLYKTFSKLNDTEIISWNQCINLLYEYRIALVCSHSFLIDDYLFQLNSKGISFEIIRFESIFFKNLDGYNKLLLSKHFYVSFSSYEYILLYQLDAFVFKNDLDYWVSLGYSYVGAPWIQNYRPGISDFKLWKVGNGGFTLRKVKDCIRVLNTFSLLFPWSLIIKSYCSSGFIFFIKNIHKLTKRLLSGNNTFWLFNDYHIQRSFYQEDYFWGVFCDEKFSWYKVPSPEVALKFSFEVMPEEMYKANNSQLPTGCHAWEKYDPHFWKPLIERFGFKLPEVLSNSK